MTKTTTLDVTVEEVASSLNDQERYQVVAYPTEQGTVVIIREWPTLDAE